MKTLLTSFFLLLGMTLSAQADLVHSFEGSLDGWTALSSTKVTDKAVAPGEIGDGVPAVAITDGTYALAATHTARTSGGEIGLIRINNAETDWFAALKDPDAVSMLVDVHVPASAMAGGSWGQVGLRLQGGGIPSTDETTVFVKTGGVFLDQTVTVEMDLTGIDLTVATWAQATILVNANPANLLSPVYLDNYRIVIASVPEPASVLFFSMSGLMFGLVRHRTR